MTLEDINAEICAKLPNLTAGHVYVNSSYIYGLETMVIIFVETKSPTEVDAVRLVLEKAFGFQITAYRKLNVLDEPGEIMEVWPSMYKP